MVLHNVLVLPVSLHVRIELLVEESCVLRRAFWLCHFIQHISNIRGLSIYCSLAHLSSYLCKASSLVACKHLLRIVLGEEVQTFNAPVKVCLEACVLSSFLGSKHILCNRRQQSFFHVKQYSCFSPKRVAKTEISQAVAESQSFAFY